MFRIPGNWVTPLLLLLAFASLFVLYAAPPNLQDTQHRAQEHLLENVVSHCSDPSAFATSKSHSKLLLANEIREQLAVSAISASKAFHTTIQEPMENLLRSLCALTVSLDPLVYPLEFTALGAELLDEANSTITNVIPQALIEVELRVAGSTSVVYSAGSSSLFALYSHGIGDAGVSCTVSGTVWSATSAASAVFLQEAALHLHGGTSAITFLSPSQDQVVLVPDLYSTEDTFRYVREQEEGGICVVKGRTHLPIDCEEVSSLEEVFSLESSSMPVTVERWELDSLGSLWLARVPPATDSAHSGTIASIGEQGRNTRTGWTWLAVITDRPAGFEDFDQRYLGVGAYCFGTACKTYIVSHVTATAVVAVVFCILAVLASLAWKSAALWLEATADHFHKFSVFSPEPFIADVSQRFSGTEKNLLFGELHVLALNTERASNCLTNYKAFYKGKPIDVGDHGDPTRSPGTKSLQAPQRTSFVIGRHRPSGADDSALIELVDEEQRDSSADSPLSYAAGGAGSASPKAETGSSNPSSQSPLGFALQLPDASNSDNDPPGAPAPFSGWTFPTDAAASAVGHSPENAMLAYQLPRVGGSGSTAGGGGGAGSLAGGMSQIVMPAFSMTTASYSIRGGGHAESRGGGGGGPAAGKGLTKMNSQSNLLGPKKSSGRDWLMSQDSPMAEGFKVMAEASTAHYLEKIQLDQHDAVYMYSHDGLLSKRVATFVTVKLHDVTNSDLISPRVVFDMSQTFLEIVLHCAEQFNGDVHQFQIDTVTIGWNALGPYPFHEVRACLCSLHIASALSDSPMPLNWTIAITTGQAVAGTVGNQRNRSVMVNGDCYFLGPILCDAGKVLHARILTTEAVHTMARTQLWCIPVDVVELSGMTATLFELRGRAQDAVAMENYYVGFSELCSQRFDRAVYYLAEALKKSNRNDRQCYRLMSRAKELLASDSEEQYTRMGPSWIIHEHGAEVIELPEEISYLLAMAAERRSTGERRVSVNPELLLRAELEDLTQTYSSVTPLDQLELEPAAEEQEDAVTIVDYKQQSWQRSDKMIGKGTFGSVYVGLAPGGSLVAIKMINLPQLLSFSQQQGEKALPKEIEDLISEVGMLAKLRHPHVTGYLSSAITSTHSGFQLSIMMEYISGGSVSRLLSTFGCISLPCVKRYVQDILKGLVFLHSNDILHRDISPNNILLTIEGSCKLTDFGCASHLQKLQGGAIQGTPSFMAPEACRGEPCKASDIWSLGILTYYMLTGGVPFPTADLQPVERFIKRLGTDKNYRPDLNRRGTLNEEARSLVEECLYHEPHKRATAEQLLMHRFIIG